MSIVRNTAESKLSAVWDSAEPSLAVWDSAGSLGLCLGRVLFLFDNMYHKILQQVGFIELGANLICEYKIRKSHGKQWMNSGKQ